MSEYVADDGFDPFERADAAYRLLEQEFAGPDSDGWTHAEMEDWLDVRGREVIRQLFQDRSDLRTVRERREPVVVGADKVERTRTEPGHSRGLATIFGPIRVERMAYRAVGAPNLYPGDARWNLPEGLHSHGLARWAAIESARGSFESAQTAIERATGVRMGKRQLEDSVVASAADIDEFYRRRRPTPVGDHQVLVLTCDGKGVVMRPEALREGTARAAAAAAAKLSARVSPGEKTNRKRMAELACVYDAVPAVRAPSDVIGPAGTTKADTPRRTGPEATGEVVDRIGRRGDRTGRRVGVRRGRPP